MLTVVALAGEQAKSSPQHLPPPPHLLSTTPSTDCSLVMSPLSLSTTSTERHPPLVKPLLFVHFKISHLEDCLLNLVRSSCRTVFVHCTNHPSTSAITSARDEPFAQSDQAAREAAVIRALKQLAPQRE
jgi:hypothetical protein